MKLNAVDVLKHLDLIDLDSGDKVTVNPGCYHLESEEQIMANGPHLFYRLMGTRRGAIAYYWEDKEKDGTISLTRIAEGDDPTLDGIPLPIKSVAQLTAHQKEHMVCGHLVKGKFLCTRCTLKHSLTYPHAIAVYPVNIMPYSQNCSECGIWVFNIWQSKKGGPLALFD